MRIIVTMLWTLHLPLSKFYSYGHHSPILHHRHDNSILVMCYSDTPSFHVYSLMIRHVHVRAHIDNSS